MTATRKAAKPIIEAKLYPGVGAGNPITRKQLYPPEDFLRGASTVFLVKAPAGYGKSTLMSQLHECIQGDEIDCAWLSLDLDDNDPARFIQYLIAAIGRVHPSLFQDTQSHADAESSNSRSILESLAHDLGNLHQRLIVFLDDIQFINNEETLGILDWLISYAPPHCQFVLGSREEPDLHLGKLRVRRRLLEIDIGQMAFSAEEAREFLNARLTPALSDTDVASLHKRTEGWPAGLELAVLALENEVDRSQLIQTFAGDDQNVVDYLGEVVLNNLGNDIRRFVYQIAQFQRVSGKLAEHISGRKDAALLLEEIRSRNMFLIPLDRQGEWCRFHHFVGQYLRDRCRLEAPEVVSTTLLDGAHWLYRNNQTEEAINCALRAEEWELAAQWMADNAVSFIHEKGYLQTMLGWMNVLPREWLDRHPGIRSSFAFAMAFYSRRHGVEEQIQTMREHRDDLASREKPDNAAIDEMDCLIGHLEILSCGLRDRGSECRDQTKHWLERWPDADINLRGDAWNLLAYGHKSCGQIDLGLQATENSRRCAEEGGFHYVLLWSYLLRGFLFMKRGDYRQARENAQQGLQVVRQLMGGHRANSSMYHSLLGCIAYEFDQQEDLARHVDACSVVTDDYVQADFTILGFLAQARMLFLRGESESALECLHNGQQVGETHDLSRITLSLAAEECVWLCRLKRLDEARQVAIHIGIPIQDRLAEHSKRIHLDKALRAGSRIFLHEDPTAAAKALASGIRYCEKNNYRHRQVELLLIQAIACQHASNTDQAMQAIRHALSLGAERGYYRMFLDEANELGDLFMQLELDGKDKTATQALLVRLQQALKQDAAGGYLSASAGDGLIEKLSKRETQILRRLDSDLSNREIAEAIFVSEGTLKWHLHNIYGKLGVKNRSGALIRARELNYL